MGLLNWLPALIKIKDLSVAVRNLSHAQLVAAAVLPAGPPPQPTVETRPRVPGTRWLPPAEVAAPVLAVRLDEPDRLMADYTREGAIDVGQGDPFVVDVVAPGGAVRLHEAKDRHKNEDTLDGGQIDHPGAETGLNSGS